MCERTLLLTNKRMLVNSKELTNKKRLLKHKRWLLTGQKRVLSTNMYQEEVVRTFWQGLRPPPTSPVRHSKSPWRKSQQARPQWKGHWSPAVRQRRMPVMWVHHQHPPWPQVHPLLTLQLRQIRLRLVLRTHPWGLRPPPLRPPRPSLIPLSLWEMSPSLPSWET